MLLEYLKIDDIFKIEYFTWKGRKNW